MSFFPDVVGQEEIKSKLSFFITGYKKSRVVPSILLIGPKGCGKTKIATDFARNLNKKDSSDPKPLIKINGAVLKNSDVFFDNFFIPYVHDKEVTVLIDECHEMNIGLVTELLTLFDTTENNKTSLSFPDYTAEIDFSVQSFIFATSEPHRVFKPFQSRLEKIAFEDYTLSEFGQIIKKFVKNCKFNEEVLNEFSSCLRGDAREAAKAAKLIESYLLVNNRNTFEKSDWDKFRNYLNIRPLGLNSQEIKLLKLLKDGAMTLTALASSLEMSSSSVRRDLELMLLKQKLISIREDGRHLTKRGLEYLAKIP